VGRGHLSSGAGMDCLRGLATERIGTVNEDNDEEKPQIDE
jgi:hypothetical protein